MDESAGGQKGEGESDGGGAWAGARRGEYGGKCARECLVGETDHGRQLDGATSRATGTRSHKKINLAIGTKTRSTMPRTEIDCPARRQAINGRAENVHGRRLDSAASNKANAPVGAT